MSKLTIVSEGTGFEARKEAYNRWRAAFCQENQINPPAGPWQRFSGQASFRSKKDRALAVICLDQDIVDWLLIKDPMALRQVQQALTNTDYSDWLTTINWVSSTDAEYEDRLGAVPPAARSRSIDNVWDGFLVGEPHSHRSGVPTFWAYKTDWRGGVLKSNSPVTFGEFKVEFPRATLTMNLG